MNLEKVIFGFFIILACTLNFGFVIGDLDRIDLHHPSELFAALVINLVATVLKFGDRTHIGATHLATSSRGPDHPAAAAADPAPVRHGR